MTRPDAPHLLPPAVTGTDLPRVLVFGALGAIVAGLVCFAMCRAGFIGFHYPQVIADQPLANPVEIVSRDGRRLTLADGRVYRLNGDGDLGGAKDLLPRVQVAIDEGADGSALISMREHGWVCGTPWNYAITIPLFADRVYKNRVRVVASAARVAP